MTGINQSLEFIVRVGVGASDGTHEFLGSGFLVAPDQVLTCRHVVQKQTPYGQSTEHVLTTPAVQAGDGPWVPVVNTAVALTADLALLTLGTELAVPSLPPFLWGISQAVSERLRTAHLLVIGYTQRDAQGPLWRHPLQDLWLLPSVREDSGLLSEVQLHGGIPAGCSGSPVLLPLGEHWAYAGIVYLGGERSATSRLILADPVVEFLHHIGLHAITRLDAVRALAGPAEAVLFERPAATDRLPNPYRGLSAFREADAPYFFGREDDSEALWAAVREHPIVTLVGASGSGKSSLLWAGLVPRLRQDPTWLIATFRPKADPFGELAGALIKHLYPALDKLEQQKKRKQLARDLGNEALSLVDLLILFADEYPEQHLLIIADQFEELYTQAITPEHQRRLLDNLLAPCAHQKAPGACTLLLCLRADFLNQALGYEPLAATLQNYPPQLLGPLKETALRAAMAGPAELLGVTLEAGLSERIVQDLGHEPGNLPLLEFALTQLWERQFNTTLSHQAYDAIGGVAQALAHYADKILSELKRRYAVKEDQLRRVFVQLVRPGEGTEDTRQVATRKQVGEANWPLVQTLADARLVVASGKETNNEDKEESVELVHEALIQYWKPLQRWIDQDRQFRLWQNRLRHAWQEWEYSHRDEGALLRGAKLAEAEEQLQQHRDKLSEEERGYIETSIAVRDREAAVQSRWRWGLTIGALIVALLMAGLAGYGFRQQQRAEAQRVAAQEAKAKAELNEQKAVKAQQEAEKQRKLALAQQLASQATLALTKKPIDLVKATLLAIESLKWVQTVEGYSVWEQTMSLLPRRINRLEHEGDVDNIALNPNNNILASTVGFGQDTHASGTAQIWDLQEGKPIAEVAHHGQVVDLTFSRDGRLLAAASWDHTVSLLDRASGTELYRIQADNMVLSTAFDSSGRYLAIAGKEKAARLIDVNTREEIARVPHPNSIGKVDFTVDGQYLATSCGDNMVRLWDVETKQLHTKLAHKGYVYAWAFSPDGSRMVTASGDNIARIWDLEKGEIMLKLAHDDKVHSIAFDREGRKLATSSQDKTARIWDATSGVELTRLTHEFPVREVVFNRDGQLLAATLNSGKWAHDQGEVLIWNTSDGSLVSRLLHEEGQVNDADFRPDSNQVATASWDGTVRLWSATTGKAIKTLKHQGSVHTLAFPPDGKALATGTRHSFSIGGYSWGYATLWDLKRGKELSRFGGHPRWLTDIAFSDRGHLIATASWDGTARIWDAATTIELAKLKHAGPVFSLGFAADDTRLITGWDAQGNYSINQASIWDWANNTRLTNTGGDDGMAITSDGRNGHLLTSNGTTLNIWDAANGQKVAQFMHDLPIKQMALSSDGERLVIVASNDAGLSGEVAQVWDISTHIKLFQLIHGDHIEALAFSADNRSIITGGRDHTARIWDSTTGEELARLDHDNAVYKLVPSRDGAWLAVLAGPWPSSVRLSNEVQVWDRKKRQLAAWVPLYRKTPQEVIFSGDSHWVAIADGGPAVRLVDPATAKPELSRADLGRQGIDTAISPDGRLIATRRRNAFKYAQVAEVREVATGTILSRIDHDAEIWGMVFSPDGARLATHGKDKTTRLWDVKTGREQLRFPPPTGNTSPSFSPDGRRIMISRILSAEGYLNLHDTATGAAVGQPMTGVIRTIAFSSDSRYLATGEGDYFDRYSDIQRGQLGYFGAKIWDAETGRELMRLPHKNYVSDVAFSPDGKLLATQTNVYQDPIRLWSAQTGEFIAEVARSQKREAVVHFAFSPDGRVLAANTNNEISVWRLSDYTSVALIRHEDLVDFTFSPDGRLIAARVGEDLLVWDWAQARALVRLKNVKKIQFTSDSARLVIVHYDNKVRVWQLLADNLVADACSRIERNLTHEEWRAHLGDVPYRPTCPDLLVPEK